jgi:hypothetical protein
MMLRRTLVFALEIVGGIVAGAAVLLGLFFWRLSQGPISLDVLEPLLRAEMERQGDGQGVRVRVGELELTWEGLSSPLEIRARRLTADASDAQRTIGRIVTVPEMGVSLDLQSLLRGTVSPTEMELVRPIIHLSRMEDGSLQLDVRPTAQTGDEGASLGAALVQAILGPVDPSRPFGRLSLLRIVDAEFVIDDLRAGRTWEAARSDLTLRRVADGVTIEAAMTLLLGAGASTIVLDVTRNNETGVARTVLRTGSIGLRDLAAVAPELGAIGRLGWTVGGQLEVDLARDFAVLGARATLERTDAQGRLVASAGPPTDDGGRQLEVWVEQVSLATLAPLLADPGLLGDAAVTVDAELRARLDPAGLPTVARFSIRGSDGTVAVPALDVPTTEVRSLLLDGAIDVGARRLHLETLDVDLGGPRLSGSATATLDPDGTGIGFDGKVSLAGVPVDDLARRWPRSALPNARDWIVDNIRGGTIDTVSIDVGGRLRTLDGEPEVDRFEGTVEFRDTSVHYLRPMPPVTGVSGVATVGLTRVDVRAQPGARLRDIAVGAAHVAILGLDAAEQRAEIEIPIQGPVRSMLGVLDGPPLDLIRRIDLTPARVAGTGRATLRFGFPLLMDLPAEDVEIAVDGTIEAGRITAVAPSIDATDGRLKVAVTQRELTIEGPVRLNGVPVEARWQERFSGPEPRTRLAVRGNLDLAARARLGLPALPMIRGPVPTRMDLVSRGNRRQRITATMDLTPVEVELEPIAWRKRPGERASARITADVTGDRILGVHLERLEGPGFLAEARFAFAPGSDDLRRIDLVSLSAEGSRITGVATRDTVGWSINLTGSDVDLRRVVRDRLSVPANPDTVADDGPPFAVTMEFGRVRVTDEVTLTSLLGRLSVSDGRLVDGDLAATAEGGRIRAEVRPDGDASRFRVETSDLGRVLAGLSAIGSVRGGHAIVEGRRDPDATGGRITGRIEANAFHVVRMPTMVRLFNALSLGGLADLLGNDGISVDRLTADFARDGSVLRVGNGRMWGGQLGLTAQGRIDTTTDRIDVEGTVVPLYGLNQILGAIPLIGTLLTGGDGQGLLAANWTLTGTTADPRLGVNPLSLFAPGLLRRILFPPSPPALAEEPR